MSVSRAVVLFAALSACAHPEGAAQAPLAQAPAAQAVHLPTALDLLLGHRAELRLRPQQIDKLQALAKKLDATNAPLEEAETKLDAAPAATTGTAAPAAAQSGGWRGGGRRGGMGRGRGGGRAGPTGARPAVQARPHEPSDKAGDLRRQMAENHAAAVAEAFAGLDPDQQQAASALLDANDFDPPTVESVEAAQKE
jgi:hypothetical protein